MNKNHTVNSARRRGYRTLMWLRSVENRNSRPRKSMTVFGSGTASGAHVKG